MMRFATVKPLAVTAILMLAACDQQENVAETEPPVRGLKTIMIKEGERETIRYYPSVLQPATITSLSFEIAGRLGEVSLDVGQRVTRGQVLAALDPKSLELEISRAGAALRQGEITAQNARENLERQETLFERGTVTRVALDNARVEAEAQAAQVDQARSALELAQENLTKAQLTSPYDAIINSVDVKSFSTVNAGAPVATLYAADGFEVSFSVNFDTVSHMAVGKIAAVRLADSPSTILPAVVTEIGSRADTVASFPVVVTLQESNELIKAGMAVEVELRFVLPQGQGYGLPLSAGIRQGQIRRGDPDDPSPMDVFVYDEATSTVQRRTVQIAGIRENSLLVVDGLSPGERVAVAGVPFLRDGQKVKLLADSE